MRFPHIFSGGSAAALAALGRQPRRPDLARLPSAPLPGRYGASPPATRQLTRPRSVASAGPTATAAGGATAYFVHSGRLSLPPLAEQTLASRPSLGGHVISALQSFQAIRRCLERSRELLVRQRRAREQLASLDNWVDKTTASLSREHLNERADLRLRLRALARALPDNDRALLSALIKLFGVASVTVLPVTASLLGFGAVGAGAATLAPLAFLADGLLELSHHLGQWSDMRRAHRPGPLERQEPHRSREGRSIDAARRYYFLQTVLWGAFSLGMCSLSGLALTGMLTPAVALTCLLAGTVGSQVLALIMGRRLHGSPVDVRDDELLGDPGRRAALLQRLHAARSRLATIVGTLRDALPWWQRPLHDLLWHVCGDLPVVGHLGGRLLDHQVRRQPALVDEVLAPGLAAVAAWDIRPEDAGNAPPAAAWRRDFLAGHLHCRDVAHKATDITRELAGLRALERLACVPEI